MMMLERLIRKEMRKQDYKPEDARGVKKSDVLAELDADTIQLMSAIPKKTMDKVWSALGVEDG